MKSHKEIMKTLAYLALYIYLARAQKCHVSVSGIAIKKAYLLESHRISDIHTCYGKCEVLKPCQSINFYRDSGICELNNISISVKPSSKVIDIRSVYFEHPNPVPHGSDPEVPAESCQQIKSLSSSAISGLYWVKHALYGNSEEIYCDMNLQGTECSNYTMLTDPTRKSTAGITVKGCDKTIVQKWYRFSGTAGDMMQSTCVPTYRCNTDAPGWLKDSHPTVEQGILSKKVCFHWRSNCCHWNKYIRIRNCGSFYVYELIPAPVCHLRYCGAG